MVHAHPEKLSARTEFDEFRLSVELVCVDDCLAYHADHVRFTILVRSDQQAPVRRQIQRCYVVSTLYGQSLRFVAKNEGNYLRWRRNLDVLNLLLQVVDCQTIADWADYGISIVAENQISFAIDSAQQVVELWILITFMILQLRKDLTTLPCMQTSWFIVTVEYLKINTRRKCCFEIKPRLNGQVEERFWTDSKTLITRL